MWRKALPCANQTKPKQLKLPLVSIIIPVYNCPGYLPGAVDSVLIQSSADWELIIVDDGSDDGVTPGLCDSLASADNRVRVLHTPNRGVSAARNIGIDHARGDFMAFLDADDLLHPDFLKFTLAAAVETSVDIVFARFRTFSRRFDMKPVKRVPDTITDTPVSATEAALYQTGFDNALWAKLYNSRLWQGLRLLPDRRYEDLDIFYKLMLKSDKVALVPLELYGYRQHAQSYMHIYTPQRADMLAVVDDMRDWIGRNAPQLSAAAADRRFSAYFNMLMLMYRNRVSNPEMEKLCLDVIRAQSRCSLRNHKVRIKNRLGALAAIAGGRTLLKLLSHLPL